MKRDPPTIETNAVQEADELLQAGLAASQANDPEAALHLFARASAACPPSAIPHFLMGSEYAALGQMDKAEAGLANAVLLAPDFHIARYQLGLLQFSSGRAAAAMVAWEPLFRLGASESLGHFVRGFAALSQDDFTGAEVHFQAGLDCNAENPALSADIRKVLEGMAEAQSQAPANPAPTTQPPPVGNVHVLVSNYGKFGTLH